MKREDLEFVLNVLMEKQSEIKDLDWYSVLGFIELNKISGYFYNKTKELKIKLPQSIERKLSQIIKLQSARNKIMRKYIQDISGELIKLKINYAFLKGSVLSNANLNMSELVFSCCKDFPHAILKLSLEKTDTFYKAGERISNDIDILIEPKDISKVTEVLKRLGFTQGYYDFKENNVVELSRHEILSRRMNRGETAPFVLKIDNEILPFIEVDINFSLDYLPSSNSEMLSTILQNTVDYSGNIKGGIKSLGVGDFFLHLIMHQYKEMTLYSMVERNKDVEMYKLLDIYLFIKRAYIDLNELYYSIKKYSLEKEVYFVLKDLNELFVDIMIEDFLKSIKPQEFDLFDVLDPGSNKKYLWTSCLNDRIICYEKLSFLKEVVNE